MLSLAVSYKVISPEADSDLGARYLISLEAEGSIRAAEEKSLRGFQSAANACVSDPRSRRIGLRSIALPPRATKLRRILQFELKELDNDRSPARKMNE